MKVKNLTAFPFGPRVTSRKPPQREMAFVVRALYRLAPGAPLTLPEGPIAQGFLTSEGFAEGDDDRAGECLYPGDFADFKLAADVLLRGHCHAPGGRPVTECQVSFGVGAWSKTVRVVGRRVWTERVVGPAISAPAPFVTMPLDHAHAFGGPEHPDNPVGLGAGTMELPNLEQPRAPITGKHDRPPPACFGPINPAWGPRKDKVGKQYGEAYKKTRAPYYAEDFDWSYFSAAPADQRIAGYLRGDEEITFENMHPEAARFAVRLPALRVRVFVKRDDLQIVEASVRLDTLFADLDKGTLTLAWRGLCPVREDDLKDVRTVVIASEKLEEPPLPPEHYAAILEAFEADPLERSKLLPPDVQKRVDALQALAANPSASHGDLVGASVAAASADVPPEDRPALEQTAADLKKRVADGEAQLQRRSAGASNDVSAPPPPLQGMLAQIETFKKRGAELGVDPGRIDALLAPLADVVTARQVGLAPPVEPGPGRDLRGADLSGKDLAGRDLSGADLSDARLLGARLAGAKLAGANLTRAMLLDADLTRADLTGARFDKTFLNGALLVGANLSRATLDASCFDKADLTGATLEGASGKNVLLMSATLVDLDARGVSLFKAFSSGGDLTRADFSGARLIQCIFREARGHGLRLPDAILDKTSFAGSDLTGAVLVGAQGTGTAWLRAVLDLADFRHATLLDAHFMEVRADRARFFAANLRMASFYRATLARTELARANLFRANLCKATFVDTSFRGANLFQAQLLGVAATRCDFTEANTQRAMFDDGASKPRAAPA